MLDGKKRLWWSIVCIVAACLRANAADAATLGSGKGWQSPWETVTSGSLTLSVNATGGASLKTADGWPTDRIGASCSTSWNGHAAALGELP